MKRVVLACVLTAVAMGCGKKERPGSEPEVVEAMPSEGNVNPEVSVVEGAAGQVGTGVAGPPDRADGEGAAPGKSGDALGASGDPAASGARDLSAELQEAVGDPTDCLKDYQPSTAMTIPIDISAVVRPTGMVIEPTVAGRGLSNNDKRCIEQRVGNIVLSPIAGGASVPVSTTVNVEYQPPTIEEYDVGGPPPKLKDVVEPLPKKQPIAPSGDPIEGPKGDPIQGPSGVPIEGPKGVPVEGPKPQPIDGYQVDQDAERWTD